MKSYVINLDRSQERLRLMVERFAAIGLSFGRVPAVDGNLLSAGDLCRGAMTPGEVGCFLSHRECWQRIAAGEDPFGVVFEDDVILSERLAEFLADANWIPADADLVKIETVKDSVWLGASRSLPDGFEVSRLRSFHYGSGGYIISRSAAWRFLEATRQFSDSVDHVLFNAACGASAGMRTYQVQPALCIQAEVLYCAGHPLRGDKTLTLHSEPRYRGSLSHLPWLRRKATSAARRIAHVVCRHRRGEVPFDARYRKDAMTTAQIALTPPLSVAP